VLSGRGLCDGPTPRPEESYRMGCVSECDQVKINLDTYCEQVGRRGKDYETMILFYIEYSVRFSGAFYGPQPRRVVQIRKKIFC
jgi:hypothetical protein